MLKNLIKRDGTVEEYSPKKINHWTTWAARRYMNRVDWSGAVLNVVGSAPETMKTQDLQAKLIDEFLTQKTYAASMVAGALYAVWLRKKMYGDTMPTLRELMKQTNEAGLTMKFDMFDDDEWEQIESVIQHDRDFDMAHFQIKQLVTKYSIQNRVQRKAYETPQFVFARMALRLCLRAPKEIRLSRFKSLYDSFSLCRVNAPTPNYMNLGTHLNSFISCCLYTSGDTAASIAAGDHIAYTMTYSSAGIGGTLNTRSQGDPIRSGTIQHQGKLPYFDALGKAVKANLQAGRGGAATTYFSAFDPEADVIVRLQDPRATKERHNRDLFFAMMMNRQFAKKIRNNEEIFVFNTYTAPDLMELFFSGDQDGFEKRYHEYENDGTFEKKYVNARQLLTDAVEQAHSTGTVFWAQIDEINRHTPFKEPIYSSNLCTEVTQPTKPYESAYWLYVPEDHGKGEVSLCALGAINVAIEMTDEEYEQEAYNTLDMIDQCIHMSEYAFPHVGFTAKQRLNAGVGMIGVATAMARAGVKYSSQEGRNLFHRMSERHAYFLIKAALRLGQERGNAPWIHKTKWPEGWLPIDTYNRNVDELHTEPNHYPWEELRSKIIANRGIRFSALISDMPTESSSKASGAPNSIYPVRGLDTLKSDGSNVIDWFATDGDILSDKYEIAWEIDTIDLIKFYAIKQKWTDHSISADWYRDRRSKLTISAKTTTLEYLTFVKYGGKTRYYQNSLVSKDDGQVEEAASQDSGCAGACTL